MTIRKMGFAVAIAAIAAFGVASCGPKPADTSSTTTETTEPAAPEASTTPDSTMAMSVAPASVTKP